MSKTKLAIILFLSILFTVTSAVYTSVFNGCQKHAYNEACDYAVGFPLPIFIVSDAPIMPIRLSFVVFIVNSAIYFGLALLFIKVYKMISNKNSHQ